MSDRLVNADFTQRVVIKTNDLPWVASPQPGVDRRLLDRIGDEVARATSLVRYAPASTFPTHSHGLGEEFYVLEGVFSDEHGDYPAGTYVRNPPGSAHAPRTRPGCTILVKLRQMPPLKVDRLVVDTNAAQWEWGAQPGFFQLPLYSSNVTKERVALEKLEANASAPPSDATGEEIFVLSGQLADDNGKYPAGSWIRNPIGYRSTLRSKAGASYWVKRGHLRPIM